MGEPRRKKSRYTRWRAGFGKEQLKIYKMKMGKVLKCYG